MAEATEEFFQRLGTLGPVPALSRTSGTIRFDLERDGDVTRRLVGIKRGAVTIADATLGDRADCVVAMPASLFEDLAGGRANVMTAMLRGAVALDGDRTLLVRFQRLFPAPVGRRQVADDRTTGRRRG